MCVGKITNKNTIILSREHCQCISKKKKLAFSNNCESHKKIQILVFFSFLYFSCLRYCICTTLLLVCLCTSWCEQTKPFPQWIQSCLAGIISNQSRLLTSWAWAPNATTLLWKLFIKTLKPLFKRWSGRRAWAVHGSTALSLLRCLRPAAKQA